MFYYTVKPLCRGHPRDLKIVSVIERCALHGSSCQTGLLSLRLEKEETLKYRCVCRPPCGKV